MLNCPVCGAALIPDGKVLRCDSGHSHDVARDGYVNLLLVPPRGDVGDTREMLTARRRFLERGHYRPLSAAIGEIVTEHLARQNGPPERAILDAGCGEGYYLGALRRHLERRVPGSRRYFGLDVSRDAIRLAARAHRAACFVVADVKRMPFATQSIHVLLNVFAPRDVEEYARVLAPGELLVVVIPTPDHLRELRTALRLLDVEEDKQQRVIDRLSGSFALAATRPVRHEITLDNEGIRDLVHMTPNHRHLSEHKRATMDAIESLRVQVSFTVLAFHRASAKGTT